MVAARAPPHTETPLPSLSSNAFMSFVLALASSVSALLLPTNVPLRVRGVLNPLPSLKMALSAASVPAMHDCSNVSPEISPLGMAIDSKADLVSIEQGTDSTEQFSNGNTLPLVARPFGHAHFAPETAGTDADRWYHPSATDFVGCRLGRGALGSDRSPLAAPPWVSCQR